MDEGWRHSFRNLVLVWFLYYVLSSMTYVPVGDPTTVPVVGEINAYDQLSAADKVKYNLNSFVTALFGFYVFYILVRLRATVRHAYRIPEETCLCLYRGSDPRDGVCNSNSGGVGAPVGWEDACCALWCGCCVAAQMARHTADYGAKRGVCCNDVGVEGWEDDEAYEGEAVGEGSVLVV